MVDLHQEGAYCIGIGSEKTSTSGSQRSQRRTLGDKTHLVIHRHNTARLPAGPDNSGTMTSGIWQFLTTKPGL